MNLYAKVCAACAAAGETLEPVLTKREIFAAMAMQAQLTGMCSMGDNFIDLPTIAPGWLAAADALLGELAKEKAP